jgi:protein TonB
MKKIFLTGLLSLGFIAYSQNEAPPGIEVPPSIGEPKKYSDKHVENKNSINYIYDAASITEKPQFPKGNGLLLAFIKENYIVPKEIIDNKISDKIFVSFIVERDGSLTDIKVLRDLGFGTGKEAIRVLKKMPKWIPGKINGKAVRVNYFTPIFINEKR